ncbi:DNA-binding transcriptional LysR family regulator [Neobacillus ginsengisoli]|uniref:DNA-binding transcriptional LysR family regulator n=1 Tax=Neobacillus ginsengisoli TaxID=904295 RepID=A0ABT9XW84_9BACI|nr:DNA-binding transcriptional LysR family regulator [Neobacillus ginsengisoli]
MDITQLYYFVVAAEQEHMTKASEILTLAQSA